MIFLIILLAGLGLFLYEEFYGNVPSVDDITSLITGNLSASQISVYAANAGFSGDALTTAIAIALAESSGNPSAYNPETAAGAPQGLGSYGLWQIYLNAHPEFAGLNLNDPQTNANAAYQIYSGNGSSFSAWSAFKSGAYAQYVDAANASVEA